MTEAKKLIDGDTYRKLSDERLAAILIADSCSFNNSTKFKDSPKLVLEDLKLKIKQLKEDLPGPRSANTSMTLLTQMSLRHALKTFSIVVNSHLIAQTMLVRSAKSGLASTMSSSTLRWCIFLIELRILSSTLG